MEGRGDERAVTVQIGAVILLAFVVIAITTYQAQVVPDQNKEVEYNHNQEVHQRMQDLRDTFQTVPVRNVGGSVSVPLGTSYPARTIFVNPPRPQGTLATVGTDNSSVAFAIQNANGTDAETRDFWNGTSRDYSTGALVYAPTYYSYENAPLTVYENSLLYNQFDTANVTLADQQIFDGKRITLVALNGSLRKSSGTASVTVRSISADTDGVAVTNTTGGNVTITIPSTLPPAEWRERLNETGQYDPTGSDGDAYVADVTLNSTATVPGYPSSLYFVDFIMEQGETYKLRLAKAGVGSGATSAATKAYITSVGPTDRTVNTGGSEAVTVEVRDEYNAPVSAETVNASVVGSGSVSPSNTDTDGDGRATFTYDAPSSPTTDTVRLNISTSPQSWEVVEFTMNVQASGGGGGGGGGGGAYTIDWKNPVDTNPDPPLTNCDSSSCEWNVSADSDDELNLSAVLNDSIGGLTVEFGVNDTSVGTVSPSSDATDGSGTARTTLTAVDNGSVAVYAVSGGDSARLDVLVTNAGGGGGGGSNTPPTADAGSDTTVFEQQSTALDGSGSSDSDGTITDYQWQIVSDPSGQASLSNADQETATFNAPDVSSDTDVTVELTVTDNGGATDTDSIVVTVQANDPPQASDMTYTPDPPRMNEQVQFDAVATDPDNNIQTYEWDWDDDGTYESTGERPTHTFTTPGAHTVTLRVTDSSGASDTYTETVVVQGIRMVAGSEGKTTGTSNGKNSVVFFNLTNPGTNDVEVTGVEIVSVSGTGKQPIEVSESQSGFDEVMFDGNGDENIGTGPEDGYAERTPMPIGSQTAMDDTGFVVAGGPEAELQFYEFLDDKGKVVAMDGGTITVDLHVRYQDGDTDVVTVTVNVP
ncbi:PKD domain-containing protein [Haloarchaeobius sp. TZWWS8]|uniref:PKD domain-containing protein n=1 Tax=Haloarchaeobius sp. TZWWS8 TaxID=3446121 RepID=UPI003EBAD71E